ncbi:MAG: hypothetical protein KIY12_03745 [Thermoplasmata archaeon]|uniref:Uncharacterized protein n=1 Tax=Candidatus Sysuiplasma superficiale TaxID=2823368 RepID=A0A8J7YWR3_9ARCH|nr:hypothetical protein [Candidatus Sysuiplasma superficiale]MBX8643821.1 hypothetical protein [Candidatus Sysuiplasma superficiale]
MAIVLICPLLAGSLRANGSLGVSDITPTFYSIQMYISHGYVFVRTVIFDYNSWKSVKNVTLKAIGPENRTTEEVVFDQYLSGKDTTHFKQVTGNSFYQPYSSYNASNLSQTISEVANLTVTFAFTSINAEVLMISASDIHGKVATSSFELQGGYVGAGITIAIPYLITLAMFGTVVTMLAKSRKFSIREKNVTPRESGMRSRKMR